MKTQQNQMQYRSQQIMQPSYAPQQSPPQYRTQMQQMPTYRQQTMQRPHVDTIRRASPQQSVNSMSYSTTAPTQVSQQTMNTIQQPQQSFAKNIIPPQPQYEYLSKQPPKNMYIPPLAQKKKSGISGIAFPQAISLGVAFGLFALGIMSLFVSPGASTIGA